MRRSWHLLFWLAALGPAACGDDDSSGDGEGGSHSGGGPVDEGAVGGGGVGGAAGSDPYGGAPQGGSSGAGPGGAPSSGGVAQGGAGESGGAAFGGSDSTGGVSPGGSDSGGNASGGSDANGGAPQAGAGGHDSAGASGMGGTSGEGGAGGADAKPSCEFKRLGRLEPLGQRAQGFGLALAASNDTVLVGDRSVGGAIPYVTKAETWQAQGGLRLPYVAPDSAVGYFVASQGDTVALGGEEGISVYTRSGGVWSTPGVGVLTPSGMTPSFMGIRVALAGSDTVLLGAPQQDIGQNSSQGAVFVFTRSGDTWTQRSEPILAPDGEPLDLFGYGLVASDDTAIITQPGNGKGADVFVRTGTTWSRQGPRLIAGRFSAIALDGDTALITRVEGDRTVVHAFERTAGVWAETQVLPGAPFGDRQGGFGTGIALAGDVALVGDPLRTIDQFDQGAAEVFVRNAARRWVRMGRPLYDIQGAENDRFGHSVAITTSAFIVASATNSIEGSGAVFVFSRACAE